MLSERAVEQGCTQEQFVEAVASPTDRPQATTEIGAFVMWGIENGVRGTCARYKSEISSSGR